MRIGQDVGVVLLALIVITLSGMEEGVALTCVFSAQSCHNLPLARTEGQFAISRTYTLRGVVVHRVGETVTLQTEGYLVIVCPVLVPKLVVGRILAFVVWLECVFVIETVAVLVAIHTTDSDIERTRTKLEQIREVDMSGDVAVGVVLPATYGTHVLVHPYGCGSLVVVELYLSIVGSLLPCLGDVCSPLDGEGIAIEQFVLAEERGIGY